MDTTDERWTSPEGKVVHAQVKQYDGCQALEAQFQASRQPNGPHYWIGVAKQELSGKLCVLRLHATPYVLRWIHLECLISLPSKA